MTGQQAESRAEQAEGSAGGLYRPVGSGFVPAPVTAGPWRSDAQHGGPPAALLTHLCQQHVAAGETIARLSVNLLTGIPLAPLDAESSRADVSRRVSTVTALLSASGRPVAKATALLLTTGEVPPPTWSAEAPPDRLWSDFAVTVAPNWAARSDSPAFHRDGIEHRFVEGAFGQAGPALDWVRLKQPVVEGVAPSAHQRVMAVVDVGSGISSAYRPEEGFGMINADLNVAFVTEPTGDWFLLDAATSIGSFGTGLAVTRVSDESGLVALATQSLLGMPFGPR